MCRKVSSSANHELVFELDTSVHLIDEYRGALASKSQGLCAQFDRRLKEMRGAAEAKAIVFYVLRRCLGLDIEVNEDPGDGGPDFRAVAHRGPKLFIEVKYLDSHSVAEKSGLPDGSKEGMKGYQFINQLIENALKEAAVQLKDLDGPRICVVTSNHFSAEQLLGASAASELLTGPITTKIPIGPEGGPVGPPTNEAELDTSGFMRAPRAPGEDIRMMRQSISAAILLAFSKNLRRVQLVGVLHPDAKVPLDPATLAPVPFAALVDSPKPGGRGRVTFSAAS